MAIEARDIQDLKDVTEEPIDNALENNSQEAEIKKSHFFRYPGEEYLWFRKKEDHKADWDYKEYNSTERDSYLGKIANVDYIYCNDQVMTREEFGNYHYGYIGAATGIPKDVVIIGSLYAHGVTKGVAVDYNERLDHVWINMGYNAYTNRDK